MRLLHAIHDFLPRHRAGAEIYAFQLARELARRHDVWVLAATYDPARPHGTLAWRVYEGLPVVELVNNWAFASFAEAYESPRLRAPLDHVLRAIQPDVLHLHSLLNLSFALPALARDRGIPTVATLHDSALVCPSGGQRIHVAERHLCAAIDPERCRRCFPDSPFHARMAFARVAGRAGSPRAAYRLARWARRRLPRAFGRAGRLLARGGAAPPSLEDVTRRLDAARRVFETVALWVAPSAALAADFRRFGVPAERLRVSGYGVPPLARTAAPPAGPAGGPLRIGFVGTLVWHKGAHVLLEAVRRLPPERYEVRLHGDPGTFPDYVASLRTLARGLPVRFAGPFDHDRAAEVYAALDVLVVPSLWPETSPLVIHEAFQAGLPVVAARLGGIPELVSHEESGLLYEASSPEALAAALRSLLDEPARLGRLRAGAPGVKGIDEDAREWEGVYRDVRREARGEVRAAESAPLPTAS